MVLRETTVKEIVQRWGLEPVSIGEPASGYRNEIWPFTTADGQRLALIAHKNEPAIAERIQRTNELSQALHQQGLPVRHPYDQRIVTNLQPRRYFGLYYYLPGETIPWEAYTMNYLKLLGWVMADMHTHLQQTGTQLPSAIVEYRAILGRIQNYFNLPAVQQALTTKLQLRPGIDPSTLEQHLAAADRLPKQALHMDFVRGNILFGAAGASDYSLGKHSLTGILDLEKAACGPVVMDIARTLAFLLVDCKYKTENKIRKYFLQSGYIKRGQQNFVADELLEGIINLFLLYDFYKFLRHNPYESLPENEHFERTKLLLIKRHLLSSSDAKIRTTKRRG